MDFRSRKNVKVSELSEEQLLEFMESVESDEEDDFSSDDDIDDPDFVLDEISAEDEQYIYRYATKSMRTNLDLSIKRPIIR